MPSDPMSMLASANMEGIDILVGSNRDEGKLNRKLRKTSQFATYFVLTDFLGTFKPQACGFVRESIVQVPACLRFTFTNHIVKGNTI